MNQPIFITGVERSGSTLIARIMDICGAFVGDVSPMYENNELKKLSLIYLHNQANGSLMANTKNLTIPVNWKDKVETILINHEKYKEGPWIFKSSLLTQMWPVWHYAFPNAHWIIVRRKTLDIVRSCANTAYMDLFKIEENREKIKVKSEDRGWLWWIKQYENKFVEMIEAGVNCKQVWPERMVTGDYKQIYETLEWVGLNWTPKIVEVIDPLLVKSRRKENAMRNTK